MHFQCGLEVGLKFTQVFVVVLANEDIVSSQRCLQISCYSTGCDITGGDIMCSRQLAECSPVSRQLKVCYICCFCDAKKVSVPQLMVASCDFLLLETSFTQFDSDSWLVFVLVFIMFYLYPPLALTH